MPEVKLTAELRTEFGKGAARRIRRADKVPAVLYGHGTDPVHISLPGHETLLALREANALLSIDLPGSAAQLALPKQVQRDPIKGHIEHVDLVLVRRGEKVTVEVRVTTIGEPDADALVMVDVPALSVEAEATHLPTAIEVSVEGARAGTQITAGQLPLPAGVTLHADPGTLVVNVTAAPSAAQVAAELAEAGVEAGIEPTVTGDQQAAEADAAAEGETEPAEPAAAVS